MGYSDGHSSGHPRGEIYSTPFFLSGFYSGATIFSGPIFFPGYILYPYYSLTFVYVCGFKRKTEFSFPEIFSFRKRIFCFSFPVFRGDFLHDFAFQLGTRGFPRPDNRTRFRGDFLHETWSCVAKLADAALLLWRMRLLPCSLAWLRRGIETAAWQLACVALCPPEN